MSGELGGPAAACPRWLIGFLACEPKELLRGVRRLGAEAIGAVAAAGAPLAAYELAAHTGDVVFYAAGWSHGDDEALAAFESALRREGARAGLEFRRAERYRGIPTESFGGPEVPPVMAEFAHWGSLACLELIEAAEPEDFARSRYAFAMLLSDAVLSALGMDREEKLALLRDWHEELVTRGGDGLRALAKDIPYGELEALYASQRALWRALVSGPEGAESAGDVLHPAVAPALRRFRERLAAPAAAMRRLRGAPSLTRPYPIVVAKRLVHPNWLRLDIYNQYELMFLHLLGLALADAG